MSSSLSPSLPTRRRTSGLAQITLALLATLPFLAQAQIPPPAAAPAPVAVPAAGQAAPGAPVGGRRGGRGGAAGAFGTNGGGAFGPGGAAGANGGGRRGGRGGGLGGFNGGVAGPADTSAVITTQVVTAAGTAPGAAGAVGANPGAAGGLPAAVGVIGEVPNPDDLIMVNMPGNSYQEVLAWLQRNTGKIILQDQNLPATPNTSRIIFSTDAGPNNALPRKDVIKAIETLLALNGVVIVPMGDNMLKAEVAASIAGYGLPDADDVLLANGEDTGLVYGHFFQLNNITPLAAQSRIIPFLSHDATVDAVGLGDDSSIFVADTLTNLKKVAEVLKHFDRSEVAAQDDIIYQTLVNASAATVVTNLTALATGPLVKYFSTAAGSDTTADAGWVTTFQADTRTNSVLVVTKKSNHAMVKQLLADMDMDVDPTTKTEVFSLKQAVANTTATLLNAVVTGVQGATGVRGGAGGAGAAGGAAAAGAPAAARDQQFSPYVTIQSDVRTNSIVAYGTPSDLRQIGNLIDQVDIVLPQVHIDAIVTEVTLTKDQATGLSAFNVNTGFTAANGTANAVVGGPKTYNAATATAQSAVTTPAFTINGILTGWNLNTVFNVAESNSNVKVLSNPSITVTHNALGLISVGERIPTINSSTTTLSTTNSLTSTITYTNVTIELQVVPFIGKDGSVYMNISQNVSDVDSEVTINGNEQPVIGTRDVTSFVTVHDGDVLVLGGLRQRSVSASHGILFLLGEIPIFGGLFQPDSYDSTVRELIVFIKPTIIKSSPDAEEMGREMSQNSPATDLTVKYLRDHDLMSADLDQGTPYEKSPADKVPPSDDHTPHPAATPMPAPAAPTSNSPAPPATDAATPATPTAPATPALAPAAAASPAESPPISSLPAMPAQPTIGSGGFNK